MLRPAGDVVLLVPMPAVRLLLQLTTNRCNALQDLAYVQCCHLLLSLFITLLCSGHLACNASFSHAGNCDVQMLNAPSVYCIA